MSYTKGPWRVSSSTIVFSDNGYLQVICNTLPLLYAEIQEKDIAMEEASANAHLIAAAPNLLEALRNIVSMSRAANWDKATTGRQLLLDDAEKAIAKAEGR